MFNFIVVASCVQNLMLCCCLLLPVGLGPVQDPLPFHPGRLDRWVLMCNSSLFSQRRHGPDLLRDLPEHRLVWRWCLRRAVLLWPFGGSLSAGPVDPDRAPADLHAGPVPERNRLFGITTAVQIRR